MLILYGFSMVLIILNLASSLRINYENNCEKNYAVQIITLR